MRNRGGYAVGGTTNSGGRVILGAMLAAALMLAVFSARLAWETVPAAEAQSSDQYDCADFDTQEEAQAVYDQDPSDPSGLDGPQGEASDGTPGVACESLPSGGSAGGTGTSDQYQYDDAGTLMDAGGGGPLPEMPGGGCPKGYAEREGACRAR